MVSIYTVAMKMDHLSFTKTTKTPSEFRSCARERQCVTSSSSALVAAVKCHPNLSLCRYIFLFLCGHALFIDFYFQ